MPDSDRTRLHGAAAEPAVAPRSEPPGAGRVLSQKYRIEQQIGRGGMGSVFEAVHLLTSKRVAVKVLSGQGPSIRERFVREAQTLGRIKHPNIVDVYDVAEDGAELYLVMELLVGESLRDRIARGAMELPEAVSVLMPALRGVAAAHAEGVIHRDLKPDNIFLCDRGADIAPEAKVLDFGLSKDLELANEPRASNLTMTNAVMGTPLYMAPEQALSSKRVDRSADVYALALILYEMIAGRRLLAAHAHEELAAQLANDVAPFRRFTEASGEARDDARALERVLLRALTKAPAERMQSVEELAQAIEPFGRVSFVGGLRLSVLRSAPPASVAAPPSRPAARVGLLVTCALVVAALAVWAWLALRSTPALSGAAAGPSAVPSAPAPTPIAAPIPTPIAAPIPTPIPTAIPTPTPTPTAAPALAEPRPALDVGSAQATDAAGKRVRSTRVGSVAKRSARAAAGPVPDPWAADAPKARPSESGVTRSASGALGQDDF